MLESIIERKQIMNKLLLISLFCFSCYGSDPTDEASERTPTLVHQGVTCQQSKKIDYIKLIKDIFIKDSSKPKTLTSNANVGH